MLEEEEKEFLGLTGAPPERTIYLSMFHASGMHKAMGRRLGFGDPGPYDPLGWGPAWRRIDGMAQDGKSVGVDAVYLRAPAKHRSDCAPGPRCC